jgi:Restriction endonuclease BglII.
MDDATLFPEQGLRIQVERSGKGKRVPLAGMVSQPRILELPEGYKYGVTRYADAILRSAFPLRFADIIANLESFWIDAASEILKGGGGRARHTARHDEGLHSRGWSKHNVTIEKFIDGKPIYRVKNHEIDVYCLGDDDEYPGIAVEMEWNNKDPFYHRDLNNFSILHREGVVAVGVIVTRGPTLQRWLEALANQGMISKDKYGKSTTHWDKLIPMIDVGVGGECPLLLIGIEPERITGWPKDFVPPTSP